VCIPEDKTDKTKQTEEVEYGMATENSKEIEELKAYDSKEFTIDSPTRVDLSPKFKIRID
jgi:hypothetical protein